MKETISKLCDSRLAMLLLLWLCFILFNTFLGRQVQTVLLSAGGRDLILAVILLTGICSALFLAGEFKRAGLSLKLKPLIVLLSLAAIAAFLMPIAEERLHIIKYGGLGFLAQALVNRQIISIRWALCFLIAVSVMDEVIQHFLPYRVGDLRDVALNIVSGLWGAGVVLLCAEEKR